MYPTPDGAAVASGGGSTVDRPLDLRRLPDMERAYHMLAGELERFAMRRTGDRAHAADVVGEVFVRASRGACQGTLLGPDLRVRMLGIAADVVAERVGAPAGDDDPVATWRVEQALAALDPDERRALVETHIRGRPPDEVAREAGVSVRVLRRRLVDGLRVVSAHTRSPPSDTTSPQEAPCVISVGPHSPSPLSPSCSRPSR